MWIEQNVWELDSCTQLVLEKCWNLPHQDITFSNGNNTTKNLPSVRDVKAHLNLNSSGNKYAALLL